MTDELRRAAEALARLEPATADRHGVTIAPVALLDGAIAVARAFLKLRAAAAEVAERGCTDRCDSWGRGDEFCDCGAVALRAALATDEGT